MKEDREQKGLEEVSQRDEGWLRALEGNPDIGRGSVLCGDCRCQGTEA